MKRLAFYIMFVLSALFSYASVPDDANVNKLTKDQKEKIKAISAYWMNKFSNIGVEECKSLFKYDQCPYDNIDELIKDLKPYKDVLNLNYNYTDNIKKPSNPNNNIKDDSAFIDYYSNKIFEDTYFKDYRQKRKNEGTLEPLKINIKKNIQSFLNGPVEGETIEPQQTPVAENPMVDDGENGGHGGLNLWWIIVGVLGVLLVIGGFVYLFILIRKFFFRIDEFETQVMSLRSKTRANEDRIKDLEDRLSALSGKTNNIREQIEDLSLKARSIQSNSQNNTANVAHERRDERRDSHSEYYASMPIDGRFIASEVYRPGKALYRLIINGSDGEFELIQKPEVIETVSRSRTQFLEPACIITNDKSEFQKVITDEKGKVYRDGDGWKISKKASIRLA